MAVKTVPAKTPRAREKTKPQQSQAIFEWCECWCPHCPPS